MKNKTQLKFIWHFFPIYRDNLEIKSRAERLFFLVLNSFLKVIRACLNYSAFFLVGVDLISGSLASRPTLCVMMQRWQIDGQRIQNAALDLGFSVGAVCCRRHLAGGLGEVGWAFTGRGPRGKRPLWHGLCFSHLAIWTLAYY